MLTFEDIKGWAHSCAIGALQDAQRAAYGTFTPDQAMDLAHQRARWEESIPAGEAAYDAEFERMMMAFASPACIQGPALPKF